MFDGLRKDFEEFDFDQPAQDEPLFEETSRPATPVRRKAPASSSKKFLGLTPIQRFLLSVMLMMAVCLMGAACLVITGRFAFF